MQSRRLGHRVVAANDGEANYGSVFSYGHRRNPANPLSINGDLQVIRVSIKSLTGAVAFKSHQ